MALEVADEQRYRERVPTFELLLDAALRELAINGVDPSGWLLSTARVLPSVVLIPALGLRALPVVARAVTAFALAACTAPALASVGTFDGPWMVTLLSQVVMGLPVAIGAATTLWIAGMAGNLLDQLTHNPQRPQEFAPLESELSPLGVLLSLGAAVAFFGLGGPARLVAALAAAPQPFEAGVREVVLGLVRGMRVAVLLAAPLLVLVAFFELLHGLWARAASPVPVATIFAPARSIVLLAVVALLLDRIFEALALWMNAQLPPV